MLKIIFFFGFLLLYTLPGYSVESRKTLTSATLKLDPDSFYDPTFDYSRFSGRVTDRDTASTIVKVSSETKNVKYLHAGDFIEFKIQSQPSSEFCGGYVRSIEENYFVMFIKDVSICSPNTEYFRRGTVLIMHSQKLSQRVKEASIYRAGLIAKKKDYLEQLNKINQSIWTFEERKIQLAAEYDRKIIELDKDKMKAIGEMLAQKNDDMRIQKELIARLDTLDSEFDYYRIEKEDLVFDRWHLDHELGLPVYTKPEEIRPKLDHARN
jgi:hypothetical protein